MLLARKMHSELPSPPRPKSAASRDVFAIPDTHVDAGYFLKEVEETFRIPLDIDHLRDVSTRLQSQFREKLQESDICMLPSYKNDLPTGTETGDVFAADLGGSTFRLARIRLNGRGGLNEQKSHVLRRWDFVVTESVRELIGRQFFLWMAAKIRLVLEMERESIPSSERLANVMGFSWSFPVEHSSSRNAALLPMGKCFRAADGLQGQDLGTLIREACLEYGIDVKVSAIVNDSAAGLLSQIYANESTRIAVILGTGLNAAVQLPATALSPSKLSPYPSPASSRAASITSSVLVNTELSMFGKDVLTTTSWDELLNMMHPDPDFQPFEHFTSGRYLGEIVRLIVTTAIETTGLFHGETPERFGPYELETSTLAAIERDAEASLTTAGKVFDDVHPLPSQRKPTYEDLAFIRRIILNVSDRAAAYLATAIHALWSVERKSKLEAEGVSSVRPAEVACISCLGSVFSKYPRYLDRVQEWLDLLTDDTNPRIRLEMTDDSEGPLVGAAVAVITHLTGRSMECS